MNDDLGSLITSLAGYQPGDRVRVWWVGRRTPAGARNRVLTVGQVMLTSRKKEGYLAVSRVYSTGRVQRSGRWIALVDVLGPAGQEASE